MVWFVVLSVVGFLFGCAWMVWGMINVQILGCVWGCAFMSVCVPGVCFLEVRKLCLVLLVGSVIRE